MSRTSSRQIEIVPFVFRRDPHIYLHRFLFLVIVTATVYVHFIICTFSFSTVISCHVFRTKVSIHSDSIPKDVHSQCVGEPASAIIIYSSLNIYPRTRHVTAPYVLLYIVLENYSGQLYAILLSFRYRRMEISVTVNVAI